MKDKRFENIVIASDSISSEFLNVIKLVADREYDEALQIINEYICNVEDDELKSIASLMVLQILALSGYNEIASVLLKAMLKNFKTHSKARNLCERTINELY